MFTNYGVKRDYLFNEETGTAMVKLKTKVGIFIGSAYCAPEDKDFMSEKTGYYIAENRAWIEFYRYIRDCELLPQLKILEHLEDGVKAKAEKDKNGIMIFRAANNVREELKELHDNIKDTQRIIDSYIKDKEDLYQILRARRSKNE